MIDLIAMYSFLGINILTLIGAVVYILVVIYEVVKYLNE